MAATLQRVSLRASSERGVGRLVQAASMRTAASRRDLERGDRHGRAALKERRRFASRHRRLSPLRLAQPPREPAEEKPGQHTMWPVGRRVHVAGSAPGRLRRGKTGRGLTREWICRWAATASRNALPGSSRLMTQRLVNSDECGRASRPRDVARVAREDALDGYRVPASTQAARHRQTLVVDGAGRSRRKA